jgi:hypothetical protein
MTTSTRPGRTALDRTALGIAALAGILALSACGAAGSTDTSATGSVAPTGAATAAAAAAPADQKVPLGTSVTLPTDTFDVSHFLDNAAPKSPKPDKPGTHWASVEVKQCATAASSQGRFEVALADGSTASEPTAWPDGLPDVLLPNEDPYAAGDCEHGRVYFAMPDGAVATAVVLQPKVAGPVRPEVQWVIGRTSAAS